MRQPSSLQPCREWQFKGHQSHCICPQSSWLPILLLPITISHHRPATWQEGTTGQYHYFPHLQNTDSASAYSLTERRPLLLLNGLKYLFFLKEELVSFHLEAWIVQNSEEKRGNRENSRARYSGVFNGCAINSITCPSLRWSLKTGKTPPGYKAKQLNWGINHVLVTKLPTSLLNHYIHSNISLA